MSAWIRQIHRWLSVVFTAGFLINFAFYGFGHTPPFWVNLLAVVPLLLMLASGLYLFVLPYVVRGRRGRGVAA